jgi:hypothetical protein
MMSRSRIGLALIVMSLAASTLGAPEEKAPRAVEKLPKPLEGLSANLVDLELKVLHCRALPYKNIFRLNPLTK